MTRSTPSRMSAPNVGIILIALGVILSSGGLYKRIRTEQSNKNVQIIAECLPPVESSLRADIPPPVEGPLPAKSNVAIELTLAEWVENSLAGRWSPGMQTPFKDFKDNSITFVFNNPEFYEQINNVMKIKLGYPPQSASMNGNYYLRIENIAWSELKKMGMGPVKGNEKRKYIRTVNDKWVSSEYINWFFERIDAENIIFKGREVFGYPDYLKEVNGWLKRKKIKLFIIEFSPQKGFKKLAKENEVIRLHSIPQRFPLDRVMRRIVRAVRERNIRAIYLKNTEHIKMSGVIETNLNEAGFRIGTPAGFKIDDQRNYLSYIGLVIALIGLCLFSVTLNKYVIISTFAFLFAGIFLLPYQMRHFLSIAAAISFPLAALKYATAKDTGFIKGIAVFFIFSITAGILISSLLALPAFFVYLDHPRGIKIALLAPLILGCFIISNNISEEIKKPLMRGEIMLFMAILAIAVLYITRSSNIGGRLVLDIELKFRELLESVFIFRPRFKEFLWGHPLLIIGLYCIKKKRSPYWKLAVIAGLIGQVSIINTFMHIHSPFLGSVIRTFWGIILGVIAGSLLIFILRSVKKNNNSLLFFSKANRSVKKNNNSLLFFSKANRNVKKNDNSLSFFSEANRRKRKTV